MASQENSDPQFSSEKKTENENNDKTNKEKDNSEGKQAEGPEQHDPNDEEDLYALLNLSRNASREDVKIQYMRLARMLHPDKHRLFISNLTTNASANANPNTGADQNQKDAVNVFADVKVQSEAQKLFLKVNRAYKVLSDETERQIYDDFGMEGVDTLQRLSNSNTQGKVTKIKPATTALGKYDELGANIREKVLGKVLLHRAIEEHERYHQTGTIRTTIDARRNFKGLGSNIFQKPQIVQMLIHHSIDFPLTENDTLNMTATAAGSKGPVGYCDLALTHEHKFSKLNALQTTMQTSLSGSSALSVKGSRTLTIHTSGSLQLDVRDGETGLQMEVSRMLTDNANCTLRLGLGIDDGCTLAFDRRNAYIPGVPLWFKHTYRKAKADYDTYVRQRKRENQPFHEFIPPPEPNREMMQLFNHGTLAFNAAPEHIGVSFSWLQKFTKRSEANFVVKLGSDNIEMDIGSSRIVSSRTKAGFSLGVGIRGISINLTLQRNRWQYAFPIKLSRSFSIGGFVTAGLLPAITNYTILRILRPYKEVWKRRARFEEGNRLIKARTAARLQKIVMSRVAVTLREKEGKDHGLVILCARYGDQLHKRFDWRNVDPPKVDGPIHMPRPRIPSDWDEEDSNSTSDTETESKVNTNKDEQENYSEHPSNIDVTDQLQFFVKDSQLQLHAASKSKLLGFYDPCHGLTDVAPMLFVRYQLASWVYEITFSDLDPVELPSPRAMLIGNVVTQPFVLWAS